MEEYRWTPDGYLRVGGALEGTVFRPQLFPELEIEVQALTGF